MPFICFTDAWLNFDLGFPVQINLDEKHLSEHNAIIIGMPKYM